MAFLMFFEFFLKPMLN